MCFGIHSHRILTGNGRFSRRTHSISANMISGGGKHEFLRAATQSNGDCVTTLPSRHNLHHYGTFYSRGHCAFDESDCEPEEKKRNYTIQYDEHGIGHVIKENKHGTI